MEWTVAIGVDTHKEVHVAVALDVLGAQLDSRGDRDDAGGLPELLSWAQELGVPAFAVEGTGSYGAGLVRFLERAGVGVYECERPRRQERRRGKSDLIDAALAARRLLSGERLSLPRGGGRREDLRLLLLERRGAMQARNAALNQLSALLVTAPDQLRERLGALSGDATRPRGRPAAAQPRGHERRSAGARPASRAALRGGGGGRACARCARRRGRARAARGVRRGPGLRCAAARLERRPRSDEKRGILRRARRHQPGRRLERQAAAPPAQPRRRSPAQLGAPRHRPATDPPPRPDQRLLPAATRRRQDHQRGTPLRQARARPPLLPTASRELQTAPLDNIEASAQLGCAPLCAPVPCGGVSGGFCETRNKSWKKLIGWRPLVKRVRVI